MEGNFTALHISPEVHHIRCIFMSMQRNQYGNLSYRCLTKWFMCCLGALKLEVFLLLGAFVKQLRKATASSIMSARMVQTYFHDFFPLEICTEIVEANRHFI